MHSGLVSALQQLRLVCIICYRLHGQYMALASDLGQMFEQLERPGDAGEAEGWKVVADDEYAVRHAFLSFTRFRIRRIVSAIFSSNIPFERTSSRFFSRIPVWLTPNCTISPITFCRAAAS